MEPQPLKDYLAGQLRIAVQRAMLISVDADIEHLHKFRVAIRRTRSLLKLYQADAYLYTSVLKEIVQQTNTLRELDVFLRDLDDETYPELISAISAYRKKKFHAIWTEKNVDLVHNKLLLLLRDLESLHLPSNVQQLQAMAEHHYANTLQHFESITQESSHDEMHALRIQFKISRYALEFIHDSGIKDLERTITSCKSHQDHFGEIQDAANQLEWLKHFCETHKTKECKPLIKEKKRKLKALKESF
jgi:CHAD domain-containing protein